MNAQTALSWSWKRLELETGGGWSCCGSQRKDGCTEGDERSAAKTALG